MKVATNGRLVCLSFIVFTVGLHAACAFAAQGEGSTPQIRLLAKGPCADLRLSPDQHHAAFLLNPQKPRAQGLPPQMVLGELGIAALPQGGVRMLGHGVTNVPGSYAFSADSRWLFFLEGFNAVSQEGKLSVVDVINPTLNPVSLGNAVTYAVFSPDSHWLAFVENGTLKVGRIGGSEFTEVAGEVSTASFSPDGLQLAFKRRLPAGGGLNVVSVEQWKRIHKLVDQAGDYAFSPDSKNLVFGARSPANPTHYELYVARSNAFKATKIANNLGRFVVAADSQWLAWTEVQRPDEPGKLKIGKAPFSVAETLGEKVQDFAFAPNSSALAYLDSYHAPTRAGVMTVASLPLGKPKKVGYRTPFFEWGNSGRFLAFSAGVLKPIYSIDLMLLALGNEKATKILPWVFGYVFAPEDRYLLARSSCIRNGRACDLYSQDLSDPQKGPVKILEGVYSFKPSVDGARILVTYARMDGELFDVAMYEMKSGSRKLLDSKIKLPAFFASKEGQSAVYIVGDPARAGVYLAQFP